MNGLGLSRAFFEEYGLPMLEERFPALLPFLAAGLFGAGSECFGYDDTLSRDHDFEPRFCLFLPGENLVNRRDAFLLERAYASLPRSFRGFSRSLMQPVGGARHGVLRTEEFFLRMTGSGDGKLDLSQWLTIPEQALAEATNGELYFDRLGEVTRIREALAYFPEDVRVKRLAGHLLLMAQAGQYNYLRCIRHGESAAAQMAVFTFVKSTLSAVFLLNRRYQPYYKWGFRALRDLPLLSSLSVSLERLISTGNDSGAAEEKAGMIEETAAAVIEQLQIQDLSLAGGRELERHAYSVNDRIRDPSLRNMHILTAV